MAERTDIPSATQMMSSASLAKSKHDEKVN